jgi:hypothetical protein
MAIPASKRQLKPIEEQNVLVAGSQAYLSHDFVPPHLFSVRSLPAEFMAKTGTFEAGSVLEGMGRKLKGFEAQRFRNAVMRQTGFLEPGPAEVPASPYLG